MLRAVKNRFGSTDEVYARTSFHSIKEQLLIITTLFVSRFVKICLSVILSISCPACNSKNLLLFSYSICILVFCVMLNNFENVDISTCVPYPAYLAVNLTHYITKA